MSKSIYNSTELMHPGHSRFNIRHEVNTTMDMGFRIPIFFREVLPNEKWKISLSMFLRVQPMVSAPFTPLRAYFHFWYCPTRVLMDKWFSQLPNYRDAWQTFIFGGEKGDGKNRFGIEIKLPLMVPTALKSPQVISIGLDASENGVLKQQTGNSDGPFSLWDYLGFPIDVFTKYINSVNVQQKDMVDDPTISNFAPLLFPFYMYQFIFDEFYRNENLEVSNLQYALLDDTHSPFISASASNMILHRCTWHDDYFTKSLPFQQRGDPVALPLSGLGRLNFPELFMSGTYRPGGSAGDLDSGNLVLHNGFIGSTIRLREPGNGVAEGIAPVQGYDLNSSLASLRDRFNSASFDFSDAVSTDVSGLRLMFQVQKWRERAARGGVRLVEGLLAFFGTAPHDAVLQRPVFIGGLKQDIIVSEVLQTSSTDNTSPQGNIAGRGVSAAKSYIGDFFSKEHGYIMGLMWIRPDTYYSSQGINREMLRRSKYDFYWPQFAHLSERPVMKAEIYCDPSTMTADDLGLGSKGIFGYQGIYNEYRSSFNLVTSGMRKLFSYWHLAREFSGPPNLNSSFIRCMPRKDIFAVQNEHPFMVDVLTDCSVWRPIPIRPIPGLIDHA